MKNKEQLQEFIKTIKNNIESLDSSNMIMSVYAFFQKYDNSNEVFNYTSYRINLTKNEIKRYALRLINSAGITAKTCFCVKNFAYSNSKNEIDYLDLSTNSNDAKLVKNCLSKIFNANTENLSYVKKLANCVCIKLNLNNTNIILFAKGSPFVKDKSFIFEINEDDNASPVSNDLMKFPLTLSACIIDNEVYLFTNLVESIFGFENSLLSQCDDAFIDIQNEGILSSETLNELKTFAHKGKNYYSFSNFDKTKANAIKNNHELANEFLAKYNIIKDNNGGLILDTDEKKQMLNKFLCNDYKRDYIDIKKVYDAPGNETAD